MIACGLTSKSLRAQDRILGHLLPLHLNPIACPDKRHGHQMINGRLFAGFAPGGGPETFNYDVPVANTRESFGSRGLIVRSWTEMGRSRTRRPTFRCATSTFGPARCQTVAVPYVASRRRPRCRRLIEWQAAVCYFLPPQPRG